MEGRQGHGSGDVDEVSGASKRHRARRTAHRTPHQGSRRPPSPAIVFANGGPLGRVRGGSHAWAR